MAKLPGIADLGSVQANPTRPVGSYDVSGFARGGEAIAAGARALGQGITQVGADIAEVDQKRREAKYLNGEINYRTDEAALRGRLQNSTDYANVEQTYRDGAAGLRDKWAQTIPDGQMRQHFLATSAEHAEVGADAIRNVAFHGAAQADDDARKSRVLGIHEKIGQNPDDPLIASDIDTYNLHVDTAAHNGYITPERADLEKRQAAVGFQTTEAGTKATNPATELQFLRETNQLPRGEEALPTYWNKDVAARATGVNPDLMAVVKRASEISGVQFVIGDKGGTRDQATQDQLVAGGFSQTRNSKHLTGNAIDLIPIVDGKATAEATPEQSAEISRAMKQASTELGVNVGWGGDWKDFKDVAHFELPKDYAPAPNRYPLVDGVTLMRLGAHARGMLKQQAQDLKSIANQRTLDQAQEYERNLIDASSGRAALVNREAIQSDPVLNETHRNALLRQWDQAAGANADYDAALAKFNDPDGGTFNPFNEKDRKQLGAIYTNLAKGGPEKVLPALQQVVDRTGIVPGPAVESIHGALVSNSSDKVMWAAQIARNLMAKNPTIFAGAEGHSAIEDAAVSYARYVDG